MANQQTAGASGRGSVRSQYKAQTRQRLAEAAMLEFEERGYVQCTIEDIAKRAGTSRATFYIHFASKAELAENMWDVVRRSLVVLYRDLIRLEVRSHGALVAWLDRTYAFYTENRQRLLAIHEAIAIEADLADAYGERVTELAELVAPLVRPELGDTDERRFGRAALLTVQHERFCFLWILRGMPAGREEMQQAMAELWFEQLGTEPLEPQDN